MATDKQIAANRLNAQKCTGPRTPEGKAISSQNALKTGLDAKSDVIRSENPSDYEMLIAEYYARFNPATPEERCLVDALVKSEWLGRRYMAVEAQTWEHGLTGNKSDNLGFVFMRYSETFCRLDRRIASAQRDFQQTLKQLLAIQSERALEPAPIVVPDAPPDAPALSNRDCEGAAVESPNPSPAPSEHNATEPLSGKLVSFPTGPQSAATEDLPPLAA